MANNTSDAPSCQEKSLFNAAVTGVVFFENYAILPLYFIVSISSHILCLLAYHRQSKKEHAYLTQIFITISETVQIFTTTICVAFQGLWHFGNGPGWFLSCYPCIAYLAYCAGAFENVSITITLFLTLAMAADRLYAIWRPHLYKSRHHKRDHITAAVVSLIFGVLINVYQIFQAEVGVDDDGHYTVVLVAPKSSRTVATLLSAFAQLRVAVRLLATICLICFNLLLLHFYNQRSRKVQQMAQSSSGSASQRKKKEEEEKTLLLLSVIQSLYVSVGMTLHGCMVLLIYSIPTFFSCGYRIMSPAIEIVFQTGDIVVFITMMITRPHYRKMILAGVPCLRNKVGGTAMDSYKSTEDGYDVAHSRNIKA